MSTRSYAVTDKGLVVKIQEINVEKFCAHVRKHNGIDLKAEEDEDIYEIIRQYICDDSQYYLGETWQQGVICHKWSYGNDISGDFIPILEEVSAIEIDVENDDWVIMCLPRYTSLFQQAYASEEALISEIESIYSEFLPKDFKYKERLASLCAVVWG